MRVRFSARALDDLERIADYIAADSPRRATIFVGELVKTCHTLSFMPMRWPLEPDFGKGVRRALYGAYSIFYVVQENAVLVEHIVHSANEAWRRPVN